MSTPTGKPSSRPRTPSGPRRKTGPRKPASGVPARGAAKRFFSHYLVRHAILAVSLVVIFLFAAALLLGLFTRHNRYRSVPDFVGMSMSEAAEAARDGRLSIEINDSLYVPLYEGGTVLEQRPAAGSKVKAGRRIFVTVNSYRQKRVPVPYVTGFSLRQAKNNLETAGLVIGELVYVEDIATNYVLEQRVDGRTVAPGEQVEAELGSGVTLVVGRNPESGPAIVPRVVGLPLREAESRLWESGLNVGRRVFDEGIDEPNRKNARVWAQSPEQTSAAPPGMPVEIKLTLDAGRVSRGEADSDRAAAEMLRAKADSLTVKE